MERTPQQAAIVHHNPSAGHVTHQLLQLDQGQFIDVGDRGIIQGKKALKI